MQSAKPLISIIMPVYNATATLKFAIASLLAQTYTNWECIIVDDGSLDNPSQIINLINDARIQFHRLDKNYGRGYARQYALNLATGNYVTFLDADDWIYPKKFFEQINFLVSNPEIKIVSTGMAITNKTHQLMGLRTSLSTIPVKYAPMKYPSMPPFAFAPSMIDTEVAKKAGFDTSFPTAEDVDFLLSILLHNHFAVLPQCLYVYCEHGSTTLSKVSSALNYCCKMFQKRFAQYPLRSIIKIIETRAKQMCYHILASIGLWNRVISRRSRAPTEMDIKTFEQAFQTVAKTLL